MSEKRFEVLFYGDVINCVKDETGKEYNLQELIDILMKQQATIQRMKHSLNTIYKAFEKHYGYDMRNAVWLIDELSYDEIVDELYIAETDSKNRKEASMYWKKKVDEQQATINELQDNVYDELDKALKVLEEIYEDYPKNNVHRLYNNLKGLKEMME